jgi:hypothetical protein
MSKRRAKSTMANEGLWQQVVTLDGQETAQRAGCRYIAEPPKYIITLLNAEYEVNLSDRRVFSAPQGSEPAAEFLEELCILAYLINAKDMPLAGKLVKAQDLPSGQFFFRGPHSLPTEKLEKAFGHCPEALLGVAEQLGAEKCEFDDASIRLNILPRVPMTVIIWRQSEQFPARASILFDQTAAAQMPLDALGAAVNLAVEKLIKAAGEAG